jgi:hypothetical protein
MSESKDLLKWRRKQPRGKIMKPSTFKAIEKKSGSKVAGAAYWKQAEKKYKKSKKG